MLFLLPPSESKLGGGSVGSRLDLGALGWHELDGTRREALVDLDALSSDRDASLAALKLGPRSADEVERNVLVRTSPTLRALERYTGVLYDPVGARDLTDDQWSWAAAHVVVHSALFGLVGSADPIPAYRLSHDSRLPGATLKRRWRDAVATALADSGEFVVDLRSEGYVGLGPAPADRSAFVRVVSDAGGRRRALNHFNKKAKGLFVAALLQDRPELASPGDLHDWAAARGIGLEPGGEMVLVADSLLGRAAA
ncbi:YaaA family protein [Frigoribacterium salinisoli]